ncbi:MAG: ATP-binding protein [Actinobacteria bacterium]|nr:ATP-binding protein [Actinomycetota bacterium]
MNKDLLKQIIIEWQEFSFPSLITRDYKIPLDSMKIITITGPRRSGKTSLLFLLMQQLLRNNIKREQILFINFDDPRLIPFDALGIEDLLESYRELYPENLDTTNYIFFDEIQNVKNWEIATRRLYDTKKFNVFLTGSSSKMLSREIATNLRGRAVNYEILPFSFKEILKVKEIELNKNIAYSQKRFEIINILNSYFELGGFPEIILEKSSELKIRILREYIETTFLKDLVERYNIKNQRLMRELMRYLATNISTDFSLNSFFKWIKQTYPITKRTLINYMAYLEDINLFFLIKKYSGSLKQQVLSPRKAYIVDNGFRNVYGFRFSSDKGKVLENTIFLELKQKQIRNPLMELYYWRNYKKHEVDFVVKNGKGIGCLIQVCADLSDLKTKEREIKSLIEASDELNCNDLIIITLDHDGEEIVSNKKITYRTAWKWLIEL